MNALHRQIAGERAISRRLRTIAEAFVGCPYAPNALGRPGEPERLVVDLAAFDCVTFIESALALARSRSRRGFLSELRNTRYRNGRVQWASRLHYLSDWMKHNQKRGAVQIRTRGSGSRRIDVSLGWIKGLPIRHARFHIVSRADLRLARRRIRGGSIVAFASVRAGLDFFHAGLLFADADPVGSVEGLGLYHAPQSAGKVIHEPLGHFLRRNRMRGLAFAETLEKEDPR